MEIGRIIFGQYQILRLLGEGGTSQVYLAKNLKVGQLVAVKVLMKKNSTSHWLTEHQMLVELRHPAIPIIMDIEEDDQGYYIFEEYVEGKLLTQMKQKIDEGTALDYMLQLCDVLHYLHTSFSKPIIYRDLKPNNIIVMNNGRLKLIDFGIAKKYDEGQTQDTVYLGTRGYASPEQFGYGISDERTDIYSLGVTMYYILTGINLVYQKERLDMQITLSKGLEGLLKQMANVLPDDRPGSIREVKEAVIRLMRGENTPLLFDQIQKQIQHIFIVTGLGPRVGTTHLSLMFAHNLQSLGVKTALLEWGPNQHLFELSRTKSVEQMTRQSFRLKGVDYFPYQYQVPYHLIQEGHYEALVIDGGLIKNWSTGLIESLSSIDLSDRSKGMKHIIVTTLQDWEMGELEEFFYDNPMKEAYYALNFMSERRFKEVAQDFQGFKLLHIPFSDKPNDQDVYWTNWMKELNIMKKGEPISGNRSYRYQIKTIMDKINSKT